MGRACGVSTDLAVAVDPVGPSLARAVTPDQREARLAAAALFSSVAHRRVFLSDVRSDSVLDDRVHDALQPGSGWSIDR